MRLLVVLGEGGHTAEMLNLLDQLHVLRPDDEYHYLLTREDPLSEQRIRIPGPAYRVPRPTYKEYGWLESIYRLLQAAMESWRIVRRVRPAVVLTSGPAVGVPPALWGKMLGARVIFIENGARVREPSLTGRLMRYLADLYFVQWEPLLDAVPGAIFAGRL